MDAGIVERVACAKYLLQHGVEALDAGGPFSSGIAVLAFQDSAEMLLGAIGEHVHATVKDKTDFITLMDLIENASGQKLTHRSVLIQMNRARVNFKHHGLEPKGEDARKFRSAIEGFFPTTVDRLLGLDYEMISLSALIQNTRTRNWMQRAESHYAKSEFPDAIFSAAVAFDIALKRKLRRALGSSIAREAQRQSGGAGSDIALIKTAEAIDQRFRTLEIDLYLVGSGVSASDLQRFNDLSPQVLFTVAKVPRVNFGRGLDFSDDETRFCISFVQGTILKIQAQYSRMDEGVGRMAKGTLRVMRETPLLVYPSRHAKDAELLTTAKVGTTFACNPATHRGNDGFSAVVFEGDVAYLASEDIELVAVDQEGALSHQPT